MSFGGDLNPRVQILLGIRADNEGVAAKAAAEIARLENQLKAYTESMNQNQMAAGAWIVEYQKLTAQIEKWAKVQKDANEAATSFTPDQSKAIKEQEALARLAEVHQQTMDKIDADNQASALKEDEIISKKVSRWMQAADAKGDASAKAAQKEDELLNKQVGEAVAAAAKIEAEWEESEIAKETIMAQWAAVHERFLQREEQRERQLVSDVIDSRNALMEQRAREGKSLESQSAGFVKVLGPMHTGLENAGEGAKKFSYGMLHVAHALQDAQYGFGAVLNNIPLVAQAFGIGPGLAGTIMIAGVAANVAAQQFGNIGTALGVMIDPATNFGASIDDAREKLKALTERPWKMEMDYQAIDLAQMKLDALVKQKAAFEGGEETSKEKAYVKAISDMIDQAGGTKPIGKAVLEDALQGGRQIGDDRDYRIIEEAKRNLVDFEKKRGTLSFPFEQMNNNMISIANSRMADAQHRIEEAKKAFVFQRVGGMATGDQNELAIMKDLARRKPGAFSKEAREAIMDMPTRTAFEKEKEESEKEDVDMANEDERIGFKKFRRGLHNQIRKRKQEADEREWEAMEQQPEHKAMLKTVAERDKAVIDREQIRKQEIAQKAAVYGGEFAKQKGPTSLSFDIMQQMAAGTMPDAIRQSLTGRLERRLADKGIGANDLDEVVKMILDKAIEKAQAVIAAGGEDTIQAAGAITGGIQGAADAKEFKAQRAQERVEDQAFADPGRQMNRFQRHQAQAMGNEIEMFDPSIGHAAAMRAGQEAAMMLRRTGDVQQSLMAAYMHVLSQIASSQERMMMEMQGMKMQVNGMQGRMGALRTNRPAVMPTIPVN